MKSLATLVLTLAATFAMAGGHCDRRDPVRVTVYDRHDRYNRYDRCDRDRDRIAFEARIRWERARRDDRRCYSRDWRDRDHRW